MAVDPRKRQKKQERKNARRKEKRHEIATVKNRSIAERLTHAARYPVLRCWVSQQLDAYGIGQACIVRQLPNGSVAVGVFLVDRFCLGVKDAFGLITSLNDLETRLERGSRRDLVSPATLRNLVDSAVAYARQLGLAPHPDYFKAAPIFGDIDASAPERTWEFGKDGKPLFIQGPHDTPERCRQILAALGVHGHDEVRGSMSPFDASRTRVLPPFEDWDLDDEDDEGEAAAPPQDLLPPP